VTPENPLLLAGLCVLVLWLAKVWGDDLRRASQGRTDARILPGAYPVGVGAVVVAVAGALLLLVLETWGEVALGVSGTQSSMTWLFGLYTLSAAFGEELVFRGYLVVSGRGKAWLWGSVFFFSLLFALLHPFLWEWKGGDGLILHLDIKGVFSTGTIFVGSIWFYAVRFFGLNPKHSLVPCIAAHLAKNLGVFLIKYQQGFVAGWW